MWLWIWSSDLLWSIGWGWNDNVLVARVGMTKPWGFLLTLCVCHCSGENIPRILCLSQQDETGNSFTMQPTPSQCRSEPSSDQPTQPTSNREAKKWSSSLGWLVSEWSGAVALAASWKMWVGEQIKYLWCLEEYVGKGSPSCFAAGWWLKTSLWYQVQLPSLLFPPINFHSNRTFFQTLGDQAVKKFPDSVEFPSLIPGRGLGPLHFQRTPKPPPHSSFNWFASQRVSSFDLEATYTLPDSQEAVP